MSTDWSLVGAADLASRVTEEIGTVDFSGLFQKWDLRDHPMVQQWMTESDGRYYRALAVLARLVSGGNAVELGARHGASALAMTCGGALVTSYDVDLSALADPGFLSSRGCRFVRLADPDDCVRVPVAGAGLLFVDIGHHTGEYEQRLHARLVEEQWRGWACYDDINWPGMRPVWDGIDNDKCETPWHGPAGFGLVRY